ncbi:hypothetical protein EX30DRAFT_200649 [Ascodesmis nigricans]|uniref:Uncharacterized protein n=1 Tax=Ascodesmis nigricans TaxID=341454 RepID=A0A4S2MKJ2_9PEZI|nr:hypothetical protein EX30DRAFT_200649 [Ascodesmis nigricans]
MPLPMSRNKSWAEVGWMDVSGLFALWHVRAHEFEQQPWNKGEQPELSPFFFFFLLSFPQLCRHAPRSATKKPSLVVLHSPLLPWCSPAASLPGRTALLQYLPLWGGRPYVAMQQSPARKVPTGPLVLCFFRLINVPMRVQLARNTYIAPLFSHQGRGKKDTFFIQCFHGD